MTLLLTWPALFFTRTLQCSLSLETASNYDIIPTSTIDDFFRDHGLEHVDILKVRSQFVAREVEYSPLRGLAHINNCTFWTWRAPPADGHRGVRPLGDRGRHGDPHPKPGRCRSV